MCPGSAIFQVAGFCLWEKFANFSRKCNCFVGYSMLLKTGSLDNAILFIGLAIMVYEPLYPMIHKKGARMRDFLGLFVFIVV